MIRRSSHQLLAVSLLGGLLAGGVVWGRWSTAKLSQGNAPYVRLYDPPRTRAQVIVNQGDGQAYAALAVDPTLSDYHVYLIAHPRAELAYRAQRPALGWLAWMAALGRPAAVPGALLILTALGGMVLAGGAALAALHLHRTPEHALLAVIAPGSLVVLTWTGPEAFAAGLALIGTSFWEERPWLSVVFLTSAALFRETVLLFPAALFCWGCARRRPPWILSVPCLTWLGWVTVVRVRVGEWPSAAARGRLLGPSSALSVISRWHTADAIVCGLGVACIAVGFMRLDGRWRAVLLAHLGLAVLMGALVWRRWEDFSRPLLPIYVLGILAALPTSTAHCPGPESPSTGDRRAPRPRGEHRKRPATRVVSWFQLARSCISHGAAEVDNTTQRRSS